MQGGPMSAFLFNVCIDPMIQDLSEVEVSSKFGYSLHALYPKISNAEFADDTGIIGNSRHSAVELYQQSTQSLRLMGLKMNPSKSAAISIVKGQICQEPLQVSSESYISCIGPDETIRYLGVTFNDSIVFDEAKCVSKFNGKIERLVSIRVFSSHKSRVLSRVLRTIPLGYSDPVLSGTQGRCSEITYLVHSRVLRPVALRCSTSLLRVSLVFSRVLRLGTLRYSRSVLKLIFWCSLGVQHSALSPLCFPPFSQTISPKLWLITEIIAIKYFLNVYRNCNYLRN